MAWFKLRGRAPRPGETFKTIESHGYTFPPGVPVEVTDEDLIGRLRGTRTRPHDPVPHPGFEEVSGPDG